jgi:hypothetical protein
MEQAEYGRDAKREQAMCAHGCCATSHGLKQGPDGYSGQYGGSMLCEKHYRQVVDHIAEHGCLPSEKEQDSTDEGLGALFK